MIYDRAHVLDCSSILQFNLTDEKLINREALMLKTADFSAPYASPATRGMVCWTSARPSEDSPTKTTKTADYHTERNFSSLQGCCCYCFSDCCFCDASLLLLLLLRRQRRLLCRLLLLCLTMDFQGSQYSSIKPYTLNHVTGSSAVKGITWVLPAHCNSLYGLYITIS